MNIYAFEMSSIVNDAKKNAEKCINSHLKCAAKIWKFCNYNASFGIKGKCIV